MGRKLSAISAAVAALCASAALGGENTGENRPVSYADNIALANRALYMQNELAPAEEGLMHTWLREQGWGGSTLSEYGIKVGGYVEVGYTWNFNNPDNGDNGFGRLFDDKSQDLRLSQLSLYIVRDVPIDPHQFDMGFGVQVIYGSDVRYFQANGTNFYGSGFGSQNIQRYPDEQIDFTQAFMLFNAPWGNGVLFKAGKFVTPWGLETIDPTQNLFYSHSLMYAVAQPKTLTGVMAKYPLRDDLWVNGGIVLGWDQALKDNNDFPSVLGQVGYEIEGWDLVFSALVGPERTDNRSDYRWTINGTAEYQIDRDWKIGIEGVFGYEPDIGTEFRDVPVAPGSPFVQRQFLATGDDSFWAGGVVSSSYRMSEDGMWFVNVRGEYFNNSRGGRWFPAELWALTVGTTIIPFVEHKIGRNFIIRPEVRVDYSNDSIFDSGTQKGQVTASIDAIFKF
jgi:hypothetical protein